MVKVQIKVLEYMDWDLTLTPDACSFGLDEYNKVEFIQLQTRYHIHSSKCLNDKPNINALWGLVKSVEKLSTILLKTVVSREDIHMRKNGE